MDDPLPLAFYMGCYLLLPFIVTLPFIIFPFLSLIPPLLLTSLPSIVIVHLFPLHYLPLGIIFTYLPLPSIVPSFSFHIYSVVIALPSIVAVLPLPCNVSFCSPTLCYLLWVSFIILCFHCYLALHIIAGGDSEENGWSHGLWPRRDQSRGHTTETGDCGEEQEVCIIFLSILFIYFISYLFLLFSYFLKFNLTRA